MIVEIFGRTEKGRVNSVNEDHLLLGGIVRNHGRVGLWFDSPGDGLAGKGLVFAVADGVGGEKGGATASRVTLVSLARHWASTDEAGSCEEKLRAAVGYANDKVVGMGNGTDPSLAGMCSTLAGICLTSEGALVFSAGDSRVYLARSGSVMQLTRPDNHLQNMINCGVDPEVARADPEALSLINFIGKRNFCLNLIEPISLCDGDVFVICSDGLFNTVTDKQIGAALTQATKLLQNLGDLLVDEALNTDECDDTSLVLLRVVGSTNSAIPAGG